MKMVRWNLLFHSIPVSFFLKIDWISTKLDCFKEPWFTFPWQPATFTCVRSPRINRDELSLPIYHLSLHLFRVSSHTQRHLWYCGVPRAHVQSAGVEMSSLFIWSRLCVHTRRKLRGVHGNKSPTVRVKWRYNHSWPLRAFCRAT